MQDEVLAKALESDEQPYPRYQIKDANGTIIANNATIELTNNIITRGTPLNKSTFLPDETATAIGLNPSTNPTVSDALGKLQENVNDSIANVQSTLDNKIENVQSTLNGSIDTVQDSMYKAIPIGTILWYTAISPPNHFLVCNGGKIKISDYKELYDVIGPTFGSASTTEFYLPDLRDYFIRGYGGSYASSSLGGKQTGTHTYGVKNISQPIPGEYDSQYAWETVLNSYDYTSSTYGTVVGYDNNIRTTSRFTFTSYYMRPMNIALLPIIRY